VLEERSMTGKTGDICKERGFYRCTGHFDSEVFIAKGEKFPSCTEDTRHGAIWQFITPEKDSHKFIFQRMMKQAKKAHTPKVNLSERVLARSELDN